MGQVATTPEVSCSSKYFYLSRQEMKLILVYNVYNGPNWMLPHKTSQDGVYIYKNYACLQPTLTACSMLGDILCCLFYITLSCFPRSVFHL